MQVLFQTNISLFTWLGLDKPKRFDKGIIFWRWHCFTVSGLYCLISDLWGLWGLTAAHTPESGRVPSGRSDSAPSGSEHTGSYPWTSHYRQETATPHSHYQIATVWLSGIDLEVRRSRRFRFKSPTCFSLDKDVRWIKTWHDVTAPIRFEVFKRNRSREKIMDVSLLFSFRLLPSLLIPHGVWCVMDLRSMVKSRWTLPDERSGEGQNGTYEPGGMNDDQTLQIFPQPTKKSQTQSNISHCAALHLCH